MATDAQLIAEAKKKAEVAVKPLLAKQTGLIDKLSTLRVKIVDGSATKEDKEAYYKAKQEFDANEQKIAAESAASSDEIKKLKEEQRKKKLSALKGSTGSLTAAKPGDLFEYVLRTQALNPYSRERACDLEFLDLMSKVATLTKTDIAKIDKLKALIKDSVSGN